MEKEAREFLMEFEDVLNGYGFSPVVARALRFFLRNPYESLVILDKEGKVEFMDQGSEKFFGFPKGGGKGVKLTELIPNPDIPMVLGTKAPVIGRVFEVMGVPRIGSLFPLVRGEKVIGAMGRLVFRSLEEIERISNEMVKLKREVSSLRKREREHHGAIYVFENILGSSRAIRNAIETAKKMAMADTDILIVGESGTGKELFAHAIHNFVNPENPFVRVNSPAIPFDLAESELFGYEKGAFSGASLAGKPGKFELADGGSIFIDELSSLPLSIQAKLLRVLQEREVERLGSKWIRSLDFRLISSTSEDLRKLIKEGKFRQDLYYRVAKATIYIPPLRERREDIPFYINWFLKTINKRFNAKFRKVSDEALYCLVNYDWPGNVRELINVIEQASLKEREREEITMDSLPLELTCYSTPYVYPSSLNIGSSSSRLYKKEWQQKEKELIVQTLEDVKGNKRRAAVILGIPRSTLYNKLKRYCISV